MPPSLSTRISQAPLFSLLHKPRTTAQLLQIHAQVIAGGIAADPFVASRLLFALCELSAPAAYAELVFSRIPQPNTFCWNTVIRLYAQSSNPLRAIDFFRRMRKEGISTDNYTYPFVLKACGSMPGCKGGVLVHGEVIKRGFDEELFVRNGLISAYCRNGECESGRRVFDGCRSRDLVSWNSMIAGYVCLSDMEEAQKLFDEMPQRDVFSWAILIDGYGKRLGNVCRARELFDEMPDRDVVCWNSMIDGYATHGHVDTACELFEVMPEKNVISWSIIIDTLVRHGNPMGALELFKGMLRRGTKPDKVCAVSTITACAQLGALEQGRWVHSYLARKKIIFDVVVQTALLDMYMKCGNLDLATRLFNAMTEKSVITWNVMIVGFGTNGHGQAAIGLFHQMEDEGAPMDDLTFLAALTSCTHAGLVSEGLEIFHRIMEPKVEHYGAVIDLLGRAGKLHDARNIIETMPMEPTSAMWGSLLAACRNHRCIELAEVSVRQLANLGMDDSGVHVLLSNIYADEGMWADVWRIRKMMKAGGMRKDTGRSVIEIDGMLHEFVNGDDSHSFKDEICAILSSLSNVFSFQGSAGILQS